LRRSDEKNEKDVQPELTQRTREKKIRNRGKETKERGFERGGKKSTYKGKEGKGVTISTA